MLKLSLFLTKPSVCLPLCLSRCFSCAVPAPRSAGPRGSSVPRLEPQPGKVTSRPLTLDKMLQHPNNLTSTGNRHRALGCVFCALVNTSAGAQEPFWKRNSSVCVWRSNIAQITSLMTAHPLPALSLHSWESSGFVSFLKDFISSHAPVWFEICQDVLDCNTRY